MQRTILRENDSCANGKSKIYFMQGSKDRTTISNTYMGYPLIPLGVILACKARSKP